MEDFEQVVTRSMQVQKPGDRTVVSLSEFSEHLYSQKKKQNKKFYRSMQRLKLKSFDGKFKEKTKTVVSDKDETQWYFKWTPLTV